MLQEQVEEQEEVQEEEEEEEEDIEAVQEAELHAAEMPEAEAAEHAGQADVPAVPPVAVEEPILNEEERNPNEDTAELRRSPRPRERRHDRHASSTILRMTAHGGVSAMILRGRGHGPNTSATCLTAKRAKSTSHDVSTSIWSDSPSGACGSMDGANREDGGMKRGRTTNGSPFSPVWRRSMAGGRAAVRSLSFNVEDFR